jgi:hypothetical protein
MVRLQLDRDLFQICLRNIVCNPQPSVFDLISDKSNVMSKIEKDPAWINILNFRKKIAPDDQDKYFIFIGA